MSFDLNLSSDEEDLEDFLENHFRNSSNHNNNQRSTHSEAASAPAGASVVTPPSVATTAIAAAATTTTASAIDSDDDDDDDDDDDENIDWEDAEDEDEEEKDPRENEEAEDDEDKKPAAVDNLRAVAIDLNAKQDGESSNNNKNKNKRKRNKRRHVFRAESLPPPLRSLLVDLHWAHLLALTGRALGASSACSQQDDEQEVLAVAHSLIPRQFWPRNEKTAESLLCVHQNHHHCYNTAPTLSELRRFLDWYFDLVHNVVQRRQRQWRANRAAGAPVLLLAPPVAAAATANAASARAKSILGQQERNLSTTATKTTFTTASSLLQVASYLSTSNDENPQLLASATAADSTNQNNPAGRDGADGVSDEHKRSLLIAMARSLGWRARYVQSMEPVSPDLDVHHPLLTGMSTSLTGLFSAAANSNNNKKKSQKQKRKAAAASFSAKKQEEDDDGSNHSSAAVLQQPTPVMGWVEILVTVESSKSSSFKNDKQGRASPQQQHRWIHVDPAHQLVDAPDQVELLLRQQQQQQQSISATADSNATKQARKRRKVAVASSSQKRSAAVLSYAVAVEHCSVSQQSHESAEDDAKETGTPTAASTAPLPSTRIRLTDVTPRYARSWITSLRRRGVLRGKAPTAASLEQRVRQSWWSRTLRAVNAHYAAPFRKSIHDENKQSPATAAAAATTAAIAPKTGNSAQEAIVLDSDDEENGEQQSNSLETEQQHGPSNHGDAEEEEEEEDPFDPMASLERQQLHEAARTNEAIPTSKAAFQQHPLYVIPSVLGKAQVLAPDAKNRVCGVFKGQLVYRREDVSTALTANKWLYQGRRVRPSERSKPVKRVKARKKAAPKNFKALRSYGVGADNDGSEERRAQDIARGSESLDDDGGMDQLYAHWQTDAWSPPAVGPTDKIPVNEYNNIELALLNPGLVHMDQPGLAATAKKLGIPYAPCLLGFEGHGGNRTPTIRGIVVHQHNEQLIREAGAEVSSHAAEKEYHDRRRAVLLRWKRLMVELLTKERLEREYADDDE